LNPRPLGYEPYDMRLWRPGQSLAGVVNSADKPDPISLGRLRLPRLVLSRCVRFTNRFTEQAIDLQFPHPSAPFHGRRPWARHYVRTRQATAKRHGLDTRRVAPGRSRRRAAPRPSRHHRYRVCTGHRPRRCLVQTPPPNPVAAGADGRRVLSRVGEPITHVSRTDTAGALDRFRLS
jgi:hypothetical protein